MVVLSDGKGNNVMMSGYFLHNMANVENGVSDSCSLVLYSEFSDLNTSLNDLVSFLTQLLYI